MVYTIKCWQSTALGTVELTLATDGDFYLATNKAKKFSTLKSARGYWLANKFKMDSTGKQVINSPLASHCMVKGPKGGYYYMTGNK